MTDRVRVLGERSDIPIMLNALDLFVLASLGEGMSNSLLEAMATELPVLATRVGGNPELVADGVTGLLVPVGSHEALAAGIRRYLDHPHLLRDHGKAGRARVEAEFTLRTVFGAYRELYAETSGGGVAMTGLARGFRVAVLTGTDSIATVEAIQAVHAVPGVGVVAIIQDRGVFPWRVRLRRLWRVVCREGVGGFPLVILGILRERVSRLIGSGSASAGVRSVIFPVELRTLSEFCGYNGVKRILVNSLNDADARAQLQGLGVDLGVVIGTRILERETFTLPRLGCINLHKGKVPGVSRPASGLLGALQRGGHRGSDRSRRRRRVGHGDVIAEGSVAITAAETEHSLRAKLDQLSCILLAQAVEALATGTAVRRSQARTRQRGYTKPNRRERMALARRTRQTSEFVGKRVLKRLFYVACLWGGPVWIRNIWFRLRRQTRYTVLLYHRVNVLLPR